MPLGISSLPEDSIGSGQTIPIHYFCGASGKFFSEALLLPPIVLHKQRGNSEDKLPFGSALTDSLNLLKELTMECCQAFYKLAPSWS